MKNARLPGSGSAVGRSQADSTARTGHADLQAKPSILLPHGTNGVCATRSHHEESVAAVGVGSARPAPKRVEPPAVTPRKMSSLPLDCPTGPSPGLIPAVAAAVTRIARGLN